MKMLALQVPFLSTEPLGVGLLKSRGIFLEAHWYWIGVGALIGYILLFNFLYTLALKYLDRKCPSFMLSNLNFGANLLMLELVAAFGKPQATLSKEVLAEQNANRTGEFSKSSTSGKSYLGVLLDFPFFLLPFLLI